MDRLNGEKHLILGNHDHKWIKNCNLTKYFVSVNYYLEIKDNDKRIALCHYPMLSWGGSAKGSIHIHGHIHENRSGLTFETLKKMDNALNAGVDINNFKPVDLFELIRNNSIFKSNTIKPIKESDGKNFWNEAKKVIKRELSDISFQTWINTLKIKSMDKEELTFYSMNSFSKSYSEQYIPLIKKSLMVVTGKDFEVKIVAIEEWPH